MYRLHKYVIPEPSIIEKEKNWTIVSETNV